MAAGGIEDSLLDAVPASPLLDHDRALHRRMKLTCVGELTGSLERVLPRLSRYDRSGIEDTRFGGGGGVRNDVLVDPLDDIAGRDRQLRRAETGRVDGDCVSDRFAAPLLLGGVGPGAADEQ